MEKKQLLLAAAAFAGLALTGCATSGGGQAKGETVMCHGVNSCKGSGQCGGKVEGVGSFSCHGANSCKGKGLTKMSAKDCKAKGGKAAS